MTIQRRRFLKLAGAAALLPAAPYVARAQAYPAHPVKFIVGQAAGSSSDITARLIAQFMSDKLGQQFVVEACPGAAGNIATEFVTRAPADGYTLLLVNAQNTINAALYDKLNFDFLADIVPVGGIDIVPLVMEVNPSVPANTVPEFIAYAKANPGKLNMASAGIGGPQHVAGELFKSMTGVDMTHVPYRGSPPALPQIKSGKLRALGATTAKRLDALPDLPTIGETVKGYEASAWIGVGAPKGTPPEIIATLNKQISAAVSDATIQQRLTDLGATPMPPMSPAEFGKMMADDYAKWSKVIKSANIKPQ